MPRPYRQVTHAVGVNQDLATKVTGQFTTMSVGVVVNSETITSKRVCEKGKNWCPFVLSLSKDERTRVSGSTSSPRTGTF